MRRYSIGLRTKYIKGYGFLSFTRKHEKHLLDTALDAVKTASKKIVHKAGEFIGNKIVDPLTNLNDDNTEKQEPAEEIIIPLVKREETLNKLRKVL